MALIDPQQEKQFLEFLDSTQSRDNLIRQNAENEMTKVANDNPELLALALMHVIRFNQNSQLRSYAVILFRRLIVLAISEEILNGDKDPVRYSQLSYNVQETLKANLIIALKSETNVTCRNNLCDTISDLYIYLETSERNWVDLPSIVLELCNEASSILRESGFKIVSAYPSIVSDIKMHAIGKAFNLTSPRDEPSVRLAVLRAFVSLIISAEKPRHDNLVPYLPEMFNILEPIYINKDEDSLWHGISCFVELAETKSYLLIKYLPNILKFCTMIMQDQNLDESPRFIALEFILTIVEGSNSKTGNFNEIAELLVPILLNWISSIEDEKEWYTTKNIEEYEDVSNLQTGLDGLDRLAYATGGKILIPVAFKHIIELVNSEIWQCRHAAILAIGVIGEGCGKGMGREMRNIVSLILPRLHDPHPRVRYAAAHTFGQLAIDFPEEFTNVLHNELIPPIMPLLDDFAYPRVQAHAAASLHNICEALDKEIIDIYLRSMLEKLFILLKDGIPYVQEQALTTIASIADVSEEKFAAYYEIMMPVLVTMAEKASQSDSRMLGARAVECISLVSLAVGTDRLKPDLHIIIDLFVKLNNTITSSDDPMSSYLLQAWTRLAMLLGKEFTPFLNHVAPELVKSILIKPEVVILDKSEDPEEKYPEEQGWEFNDSYGKLVGVRTSLLDEKCTAIEMILCIAKSMQSKFIDYAVQLLPEMTKLITYIIHTETRSSSIRTIPNLLYCLVDAEVDQDIINSYAKDIFKNLIKQMKTEDEPSTFNVILSTFSEILDMVDNQVLKSNEVIKFANEICPHLNNSIKSLGQYTLITLRPDFDEEDLDLVYLNGIQYDEEFINNFSKLFHDIIRIHHSQFFKELKNITQSALSAFECPNPIVKRWALGVFDDLVEYGGEATTNYYTGVFVEPTIKLLLDPSNEVRQAANYGVGLWAQYGGPQYIPYLIAAMEKLIIAIRDPSATEPGNIFATENVIAALAKIITFKKEDLSLDNILLSFIHSLPIYNDVLEFPLVYGTLMDLLETPPTILNNENELYNMGKVLIIAIYEEFLDQYNINRAMLILKNGLNKYPALFQKLLQENVPQDKKHLFEILF